MNKKTYRLIFILIITVIVILITQFIISKKITPLQIISVSPETNAKSISVTPEIVITLNKEVRNTNEILLFVYPEASYSLTLSDKKNEIVVKFEGYLHSSTNYSVIISNQNKQTLWQSNFTTESLQGDPAIPYEGKKNTKLNYPLLSDTPFVTNNISVIYKGPLTLEVTVLKGTKEEAKKEIEKWLESKRIDPSTHKIEWFTPEPSPAL